MNIIVTIFWGLLLLCLVVVLPWFIAIAVKSGGDFFAESVGKDMLGKVGEGQEIPIFASLSGIEE